MRIDNRALQNAIISKNNKQIDKVLNFLRDDKAAFKRNLRLNDRINALHLAANTDGLINGLLVNKLIMEIKFAFESEEATTILATLIQQNRLFNNPAFSFEDVRHMIRDHFPGFSCTLKNPAFTSYFDMNRSRVENQAINQNSTFQGEFKTRTIQPH